MALTLVHQLAMSAEKRWRCLGGFRHLAAVIAHVRLIDGVDGKETGRRAAEFRTMGWTTPPGRYHTVARWRLLTPRKKDPIAQVHIIGLNSPLPTQTPKEALLHKFQKPT